MTTASFSVTALILFIKFMTTIYAFVLIIHTFNVTHTNSVYKAASFVFCFLFFMMESSRVCRLCSATIDSKRALSLFSTTGQRQKLASRISKLLDIPEPIPSDTLPSIICWKCNQRISTLEKALAELDRMKALARSSLEGRGMK